jgi:[calcium/calmodulin-dependent protein kinase] kinase
VLKFVDFGVSEMFEKDSDMNTAKSAGSPAFMPPELCIAKHGEISGKAADIWSMGVTLYCLRYGHIPFEKTGMIELYEAIKSDDFTLGENSSEEFEDLMRKLLEKDPQKRIKIEGIRVRQAQSLHLCHLTFVGAPVDNKRRCRAVDTTRREYHSVNRSSNRGRVE